MKTGLIGYTGFVGSHLLRQGQYDHCYNSQNIETIVGQSFDRLVCAGVPAVKWLANREPEADRANIQRLIQCLQQISVEQFILISTVDVYPVPVEVNEATAIEIHQLQPYGKHRRELEILVQNQFNALIVRLPGLFGQGLKKNIIYDLLNHHRVEQIHPDGVFQFYHLDHLWANIQTALDHNLTLINIATEPIGVEEMVQQVWGTNLTHTLTGQAPRYDMQTQYYQLFSGDSPGYLYNKEQVFRELKAFVAHYRPSHPG